MGTNNASSKIVAQIKREMQHRKISLRDLSKKSMVAPSTIYDVLENNGSPRLVTLQYICTALDLELRVCKDDRCLEDDFYQLMDNLSEEKRELVKEFVKFLEQYEE